MLNSTFESFHAFVEKNSSSTNSGELKRNTEFETNKLISNQNRVGLGSGINPDPFFLHDFSPKSAYYWIAPPNTTVPCFLSIELVQATLLASQAALETSLEKAESTVNSLLMGVYDLDQAGYNRTAAQEVMLFVETNIKKNKFRETNRILEIADTSRLSSRSLIGLIRSTSRLKEQLPAWKKAYLNSRKQVASLGKNPDALFVGLPAMNDTDDIENAKRKS